MALFRSEGNTFCDSRYVAIEANKDSGKVRPSKNLTAPVAPRKVTSVCVKYDAPATGTVEIVVCKTGVEFTALSQSVSSATSVVIANIGLWLVGSDYVKVENKTSQDAEAVIDFEY
ncbi:MAG: hypothetical protein J6T14_05890 [Clostridia bacterium]|nr:hypothetical protein [Clostridia bacterium]